MSDKIVLKLTPKAARRMSYMMYVLMPNTSRTAKQAAMAAG